MEFIIGAIVCAVIIFLFSNKKKVDNYNQMTLIDFPEWKSMYLASTAPDKRLIARAFVLQTIDLAPKYKVISNEKAKILKIAIFKENPIEIVDEWINTGLPYVENHFGADELKDAQARLVGVFMFAALQSSNPAYSLKLFTENLQ